MFSIMFLVNSITNHNNRKWTSHVFFSESCYTEPQGPEDRAAVMPCVINIWTDKQKEKMCEWMWHKMF